jgi:hypothetical protein
MYFPLLPRKKKKKKKKRSGQVRSGQVRSGQVRSGQVRSGQVRSGQVRSGQVRSGQVRSGQVRSGQVRSGQVRSGQVPLQGAVRPCRWWRGLSNRNDARGDAGGSFALLVGSPMPSPRDGRHPGSDHFFVPFRGNKNEYRTK